ncbi:MAG: hypothetical protein U5Q44_07400 [Dehalococcoidia bacterium]|nr:hypothetical protein [Dehalococcoidia bacterium]
MFVHPSIHGIQQPLRTTWGSLTLLDIAAVGLLLFTLSRVNSGPHALSGDPREALPAPAAPAEPSDALWLPTPVPEIAYVVRSEADAAFLHRLMASREMPHVAGFPTGHYRVVVADSPHDEVTVANMAGAGIQVRYFAPYELPGEDQH